MRKPASGGPGQPFDLWGQRGWPHQEVAGESNYAKEIRSLFGRDFKPDGTELTLTAQLIPEPHNTYDRNAVSVQINGRTVGYLPREDAARYAPALSEMVAQGWTPQVAARVWGGRGFDGADFVSSVRLDLAEPHLLMPANHPPDEAHALLPGGNAIQVTGEEAHLAALTPLLSPTGECWVYATLHEVEEQLARSTRTIAEVRLDGAVMGKLTPKMSAELLPAVRHLASQAAATACRAILKGNSLKADVVLYPARANQLPQDWLDAPPIHGGRQAVGDAVELATASPGDDAGAAQAPPVSQPSSGYGTSAGWRFRAPPGWPPPPAGWVPSPGWRPDPSWPAAPPGWQFWVADPSQPATGQRGQ